MPLSREQLLRAHADLPEAYQPAWGLPESAAKARRQCEDRFAVVLDAVAACPAGKPLRILDIGCAQGYFSLGLGSELHKRGRRAEVVGVDSLEENVRFCRDLAEHHGLDVRFVHDRFDGAFFERHKLADFDIVLALNVLHHVRELDGGPAADGAIKAICAHSTVLLCEIAQPGEALEWVADWHASDDSLLHDFPFRRRLGIFETHLTRVPRPLYVCSNRLAYVGGSWFAFDHALDRSHPAVPERFAGQRRFLIGADHLIKVCRTTGDFGDFNHAEMEREVEVLGVLGNEAGRYPAILARSDDAGEMWLVRGVLPGTLVSELMRKGIGIDRDALARALLDELAHLEQRGFYHADLRTWNMLWSEPNLRLIDFGSMTHEPSPLHRVAVAAVMAEIARGQASAVQSWYTSLHPLDAYPQSWHGLIRYLAGCPPAQFSFAEARDVFDATGTGAPAPDNQLAIRTEILAACTTANVEGFARLREHTDNLEASFARALKEAQAERDACSRALADAGRYATSLEAQIAREGEEARVHVDSLKARIARENAEAGAEREAARAALADATGYAKSLEEERAHLKKERDGLKEERDRLKEQARRLDRMRRRFRLLKPLWPREDEDQA